MTENIKNENLVNCDDECIHNDIVNEVIAKLPDEELLYDVAELFKVFGDSTRVRICFSSSL